MVHLTACVVVSRCQRVTCPSEAKVLISLMQSDRKLKGVDQNHSIRFTVTALKKTHKGRLWHEDLSEIVADSDAATFSQRFPQREVTFGAFVECSLLNNACNEC
jgi:hypothetical protein